MSITLIFQALKAKRMLWIVYSTIGLGFILLYVAIFPSIQGQSAEYDKIFASLPKGLVLALNISNVEPTLMGYLSSKHFGFIWLLLIVLLAITYSGFAIAKEIENKTMGFLLSQPIKRTSLYLSRLTAGIVGLIVFISISEVVVWPLAKIGHYSIDVKGVLLLGVAGLLFGISVLSLGFMFSALSSTSAKVSALCGGVLLIMYGLFITSSLVASVAPLKYFSLFHYISPGEIIQNDSLTLSSIIVFLVGSCIATTIGLVAFKKRQILV
jgi:ABC-type transport system involved in multi-copper enzyme maturation permease subunit